MKKYLLLIVLLAIVSSVNSQVASFVKNNNNTLWQALHPNQWANSTQCFSDEMQTLAKQKSPESLLREQKINQEIYRYLKNNFASGNRVTTTTLSIPVVVHIIHNNGPENISDAQVIQGIQDLNDAFANTGAYTDSDGVNTNIQFCLASQDFINNPTTGITRTVSALTNMTAETDDMNVKFQTYWPAQNYLNIWLVNEITSLINGGGVAAYATMPNNLSNIPGIVNEARWFGSSTTNSKIHIHEAGHFLGLYHTFEGGCVNNNCLTDGDRVCDTPPDASTAPVSCSSVINTCNTDDDDLSVQNPFRPTSLGGLGDQPDLFSDYMDYGYQVCQTHFTQGQSDRMNAVLITFLNSLTQSPGCANACGVSIVSFSHPTQNINLIAGDVFADTARTQSIVTAAYEWLLDSTIISTDTIVNYTFNTQGTYHLSFKIYNAALQCYSKKYFTIIVTCPVQSSFSVTPYAIQAGDTVVCTSTSVNATSYQWVLDGAPAGNTSTLSHVFPANGKHYIYLISQNGTCSDTTSTSFVGVGECNSGQFNNWYFGQSNSVSFNTGDISNLPIGANNTNFGFLEGSAAISDKQGNLLFYTDGVYAYDRNHNIMSSSLLAGPSSMQGVIIIPNPLHSNLYYVFTVENGAGDTLWYPTGGGFSYSEVDMNLNGGLGGFIAVTTQLLPRSTEQLAAVKHCNGHDTWVITHGFSSVDSSSRNFYCYLVTDNGIMPPVISSAGMVKPNFSNILGSEATLKISPKGNKLATVCFDFGTVEYFDFDNNTGVVSNPMDLSSPQLAHPYGLEFSPDGSKLYTSNTLFTLPNDLLQYDLSSQIDSVIVKSLQVAGHFPAASLPGAIQLAPNGKIYGILTGTSMSMPPRYLYSIDHPDNVGLSCQFNQYAIPLKTDALFGLPSVIVSDYDNGKPKINGPAQVCAGTTIAYTIACGDSNVWVYKGVNQIIASGYTSITLLFSASGIDTLIAIRYTNCYGVLYDTLLIHIANPVISLGNDTTICSTGQLVLTPGTGYAAYLWSNGKVAAFDTLSSPGVYTVTVTGIGGCTSTDDIVISSFPSTLSFSLGNDIYNACSQSFAPLTAPPGNYTSYLWGAFSPLYGTPLIIGNTSPNAFIAFADTIDVWLTVTDSLGCSASDTIKMGKADEFVPTIHINDTTVCKGQTAVLDAGNNTGYTYIWPDGSGNHAFTVLNSGTIILNYITQCGHYFQDTIVVTVIDSPAVSLGNDTLLCPFTPFIINPNAGAGNYLWQDGSTTSSYNVTSPGVYWLAVSTANGCYGIDSLLVQGCTGISENDFTSSINLFPNPASNTLYINVNNVGDIKIEKVIVRNLLSQIIYSSSKEFTKVNISNFSFGMYSLELITNKGSWSGRFVKE